jgi:glutathionyl-hydroquinone reductase
MEATLIIRIYWYWNAARGMGIRWAWEQDRHGVMMGMGCSWAQDDVIIRRPGVIIRIL